MAETGTCLSDREQSVLEARIRGEPLKAVAAALGISVSAANTYRRRAMHKLGATNVVDAAERLRETCHA